MEKEVGSKNTKNEILKAYEELLEKVKENDKDPRVSQQAKINQEIVKKAGGLSYDGIVKEIANLKMILGSSLDQLEEKIISQYKELENLQQAITIEKKNLEELYEISANADSLAALIMAQKEQKENFNVEMRETREKWVKEQQHVLEQNKEQKEKLDKEQKREEEEYNYNLKIKRKKEMDEYEQKKSALEMEIKEKRAVFEKEITERESKVAESEKELEELRKHAQQFPGEKETAVEEAKKELIEKLTREFEFEKQLNYKQVEGEIKLKDQTIETLKTKIREQDSYIKDLSGKTSNAEITVKDIALKALESSSKIRNIQQEYEKRDRES